MPARTLSLAKTAVATAAIAAALLTCVAMTTALADAAPDADEVIRKARALEKEGHLDEAYYYLADIADGDDRLARDARVLIELSRLSPSAEESIELLEAAVERTRDGELAALARRLLGDYLYARGSYVEAAERYRAAAERAPSASAGPILLKRAAATLAAGDAIAAAEAYGRLAERGSAPDATTPWALLGLGRALLVKGDFEDAAREFEELARDYPDHDVRPQALAGAAEAHKATGDVGKARDALELLAREYEGTYEAVLAREDLRSLPSDTDTVAQEGTAAPAPPENETER